jgi:hypothetical protein
LALSQAPPVLELEIAN